MSTIRYHKMELPPEYDGPRPIYVAESQEPGFDKCLVRRQGREWATALRAHPCDATFIVCPVADASLTRDSAVHAHQFFHAGDRS